MSEWLNSMEKVLISTPVHIPTADGKAIAETIMVEVTAHRDTDSGEVFFSGETLEHLDKIKARHMGVLLPKEIKELRLAMGMTQREISELLGIGEKTYTRWETGRERPSQSLNKLLMAMAQGRLNLGDMQAMNTPETNWLKLGVTPCADVSKCKPVSIIATKPMEEDNEDIPYAA